MIQIHNELTVACGDDTEQPITLWLVSYGNPPSPAEMRQAATFIQALTRWCFAQGWQLESGDDPYQEQSLRIFDGGFSSPDGDVWDGQTEGWPEVRGE